LHAPRVMDVDSFSEAVSSQTEITMPCLKRRRRVHEEEQPAPAAAATAGACDVISCVPCHNGVANGAALCTECSICLEPLEAAAGGSEQALVMPLGCGHSFHAGRCLAPYIEAQYNAVQQRVEAELQRRFADLGLPRDDRQNAIGGNFVEMLRHGQLRQCPKCHYGPVLNTHCGDLRAHDRSRGQGTDRTTNECPTCGFFSASWSDWALWDPEDFAASLRCPLCRDPCKLAVAEVPELQDRLVSIDAQLSRADCLAWFSPADFAALLFYLQMEASSEQVEWGGVYEQFVLQSPDLSAALLQGPLLDLVRQRLSLEEKAARKAMTERAQRSSSADDLLALAQRLIADFNTPDGFDGPACAEELLTVFPSASTEVVEEIRMKRAMTSASMACALKRLLENGLADDEQEAKQAAASGGDVLAAIHAVRKLQPSERRFQAALACQDFLRAMHIAESIKPELEESIRPLVKGSEAVLAALRPLRWQGDGFATLPDLEKVVQVLEGHVPWQFLPSAVANSVSLCNAPAASAEKEHAPRSDFLTQDMFTLATGVLNSQPADPSQSSSLGQAHEDLRDRRNCLELLLSTAREHLDSGIARRLAHPHRQHAASNSPPKPCLHGRVVCEALLRSSACRSGTPQQGKTPDVASLLLAVQHMTMMAVQEVAPTDRVVGQSERVQGAMRELQRRAVALQALAREILPLDRERTVVEGEDAIQRLLADGGEVQMLIREHMILIMHRILACAVALER